MPQHKLLLLGLLAFALAGCGSNDPIPDPEPTETVPGGDGPEMDGYENDGLSSGEEIIYEPNASELGNIVYFDYDSSELRPEDTDIVASHARELSMNSNLSVRLEGHGDERGSREYNIGLGERRAQTVRRLLLIQGASASQVSTVSFGEERPAADGSNEAAYAQNRRVEITYTN
ncbi:MAG: peptidoglycan-associated lipoprotein Pal [Gammaproteobacteria bacterium]